MCIAIRKGTESLHFKIIIIIIIIINEEKRKGKL